MLLSQLPLVLLLSSFISAAAIPSSSRSIITSNPDSEPLPSSDSASSLPSTQSNHLAKRRPYYFPETVPDEEEIAARLASLREAGLLPDIQTQQGQDQKSIGTPDAAIDMNPTSAQPSPIQEASFVLLGRDTPHSFWEAAMPAFLPAAWLFILASVIVCIATVIRGLSESESENDYDYDNTSDNTSDKGKH